MATTPDDMLKLLTDLSDRVKALDVQQKTIVDSSNAVIAGLRAKVAALELAAIPEADFSPELAQIVEIEALVAALSAPPPIVEPVAPPVVAPVETPIVSVEVPPVVAPPVEVPPMVEPIPAPPVVPPVVVPDPVVVPVVPPVV